MNWSSLFTPELSSRVCSTLLHSLWQVTALAAAAWLITRLWRKHSVQWAYGVHVAALLLGFAALPATFVLIKTPAGPPDPIALSIPQPPQVAMEEAYRPPEPSASTQPVTIESALPAAPLVEISAESPPVQREIAKAVSWPEVWRHTAPWLAGLYLAGVVLMLARLVRSLAHAERLRRHGRPIVSGPLKTAVQRLAETWSMRTMPMLATAEHIVIPKVVGLIKPTILVPASALSGLSPTELEMILAHELAHVRRYDMWVSLLQRLAEAALFFNPGVWLLSRRISSLREYCCDELACGDAQGRCDQPHVRYAQALLRIVELTQSTADNQTNVSALAASGRSPSELRRRVARLFGEPLREPLQLSRGGVIALAAALLLMWTPALWPAKAESSRHDEPASVEPDQGFVRQLDAGVQAELVAIGDQESHPHRWWSPDGTPLTNSAWNYESKSVHRMGRMRIIRTFIMRFDGTDDLDAINWELDPVRRFQVDQVLDDQGQAVPHYCAIVATIDRGARATKLSATLGEQTIQFKDLPLAARHIIPGSGIGSYQIGSSTQKEILGEDSAEKRREFNDRGMAFEFNQGRELTAITFHHPGFTTRQGIGPGSKIDEMRRAFPAAKLVQSQNDKFKDRIWKADGIEFLPDDKGKITLVRVSAKTSKVIPALPATNTKPAWMLAEHRTVRALQFRPDDGSLLCVTRDEERYLIRTWNLTTRKLVGEVELQWDDAWNRYAGTMKLSDDGAYLVSSLGNEI
ncbi:MAG: M56 family metallopeptidase, partial [Pirellulales bacterium]|nr:M56 family metallopeptidase [Pirellulales bacterium]